MANFSALKTAIQNAIRQNGNEEITGDVLQQILLSVVSTMGDGAINTIEQNLSNETTTRQGVDTQLQNAINAIKANIDNGYVYAGIATPSSTPVSGKVFYIATAAGTYTNFGGQVLTQGINILRFNGSAWSSQQLIGIDDVPTAGSNKLVKSGGVQNEFALGAVYDVSAKNPTGGPNNDGKWESLAALLSDANLNTLIPTAYRKGGMSIKFVRTSDNKYIRYNLLAQSFTTDTTQWAIDDGGVYVKNPEWIYVLLDAEKRILAGLKSDGSVEWFIGVPTPVKTYIDNAIVEIKNGTEETDLDGLNKIIAFLSEFSTSDTLKDLLDSKVDKEEGKSLIDEEYANGVHYIENPEFGEVKVDSEDRILEATRLDGTKLFGAGIEVNSNANIGGNANITGDLSLNGADITVIENPEFAAVWLDGEDKILFGVQTNGNFLFSCGVPQQVKNYIEEKISSLSLNEYEDMVSFLSDYLGSDTTLKVMIDGINTQITTKLDAEGLDSDALATVQAVENPEFMEVELDANDKVLGGRKTDGTKFENNDVELNGNAAVGGSLEVAGVVIKNMEDPEGRLEIATDSEEKIISYRDKEGVLHEKVGVKSKEVITDILNVQNLQMPYDSLAGLKESLDNIEEPYKRPNIPLYGTSNIKSETFYLNADERYSDKNGVYLIQDYPDTVENATNKVTLSYFYIKSTLQDNGDGTYSKYDDGVEGHDVKLTFYAAAKVTKVDDVYYVTSSLDGNGQPTAESIEVTQITDVPPYKAWPVDKKTEHYCLVDVNFGNYLTKENIKIGIKYQGSSTLDNRKRNFRFTFYKSNAKPYYPFDDDKFGKKDKVKFGDMLRLSGYNLKANWSDNSRIKELILYPTLLSVWQQRPESNRFPWDNEFTKFTAATGFIQGFPIKLYIDGSFYGMMVFGLKKDERNYVLDGDDDSSGIFVSGSSTSSICWQRPMGWEEEMMDEMSQETTDAISEWFDFINDRLVDENQNPIPFNIKNIPSRLDVQGFIDYFICLQVFIMWDNTQRNMVLHTRSDKKKFYPFFYDLDLSLQYPYDSDVFEVSTRIPDGHGRTYSRDMAFWQTIVDTFWDDIVNRYHNLRASVLKVEYINQIYHAYADSIPDSDYIEENTRWGVNTSKSNFDSVLTLLANRLDWLDSNYFIH